MGGELVEIGGGFRIPEILEKSGAILKEVGTTNRTRLADFNAIASVGAFGFGLMQVYFFIFVVVPMMRGQGAKAPRHPWDGAEGLEWEVPSPAPFHTFENPPKLNASATKVIG